MIPNKWSIEDQENLDRTFNDLRNLIEVAGTYDNSFSMFDILKDLEYGVIFCHVANCDKELTLCISGVNPTIYDVYTLDQAEESDPSPIFSTQNPLELVEFLEK